LIRREKVGDDMIRLALDWWSYHNSLLSGDLDHAAMIRRGAELGADGVVIEYFALPAAWRTDPAKLLSLQTEFRLAVVLSFGLPQSWPGVAARALRGEISRFWTLATRLHAETVVVPLSLVSPAPWLGPAYAGLGGRYRLRGTAARLRRFCEDAGARGLTVTVAHQSGVDVETAQWLLEKIDRPNAKLALNTGRALLQSEDPYRRIDRFAAQAGLVQFADRLGQGPLAKSRAVGDGQIDFLEIMRLLDRHRFGGLCAVRLHLPWWARRQEDPWVARSFVHLTQLRNMVTRETEG